MKIHLSLGQICATNYLSNLNLWAPDVAKTPARQRQIGAGCRSPAHKYSGGLNHLFLDPVREVAQCDFRSMVHLYRGANCKDTIACRCISSFLVAPSQVGGG